MNNKRVSMLKMSIISTIAASILLIGCGGGGGGASASSSSGGSGGSGGSSSSFISGSAIKGPLDGATVTIGDCTPATTNASGEYKIDTSTCTNLSSSSQIVVTNGWDAEHSKAVEKMITPYSSGDNNIIISPVTTIMYSLMTRTTNPLDKATAQTVVSNMLNINSSEVLANPNSASVTSFGESNAIALVAFENSLSIIDLAQQIANEANTTSSFTEVIDNINILSSDAKAKAKAIYNVTKDVNISSSDNPKLLVSAIKTVVEDIKSNVTNANFATFNPSTSMAKFNKAKTVLKTLSDSNNINLSEKDINSTSLSSMIDGNLTGVDLTDSTAIIAKGIDSFVSNTKSSSVISDEITIKKQLGSVKDSLNSSMKSALSNPISSNITLSTTGANSVSISWSVVSGTGINQAGQVTQTASTQKAKLKAIISKSNLSIVAFYDVIIAANSAMLASSLNQNGYYENVFSYDASTAGTTITVNLPTGTFDIYAERTTSNENITPQISSTIMSGGEKVSSSFITGTGLAKDTSPAFLTITNTSSAIKSYDINVSTINEKGAIFSGKGWLGIIDRDDATSYPKGGSLQIGNDTNNTAAILAVTESHIWTINPATTGDYSLSIRTDHDNYKNPLSQFSVEIQKNGNNEVILSQKDTTSGSIDAAKIPLVAGTQYNLKVKSYLNYSDFLGYYTIKLVKE